MAATIITAIGRTSTEAVLSPVYGRLWSTVLVYTLVTFLVLLCYISLGGHCRFSFAPRRPIP